MQAHEWLLIIIVSKLSVFNRGLYLGRYMDDFMLGKDR